MEDSTQHSKRQRNRVEKHKDRKDIDRRLMRWEACDSIARDYDDLKGYDIRRYSIRSGLVAKRENSSEGILTALIRRGMKSKKLNVDARTIVQATQLRARLTGELSGDNTVNVNIQIPTQVQFNIRLAEAEAIRGKPLDLVEKPKLLYAKHITVDPYPDDDSHLPIEHDWATPEPKLDPIEPVDEPDDTDG